MKTPGTTILKIAACAAALVWASNLPVFGQGAQDAAQQGPTNRWEKSAALGFTLAKGNSDNMTLTANILASRKVDRNEYNLGADGTYGESEGKKNAESLHGFGQYNRLFTERWFGYARADGLHDGIADIEYRFILSPGAGYYFIKKPSATLRGEVGPGFVFEKLGEEYKNFITLRLAERYDQKLSDRVKLWEYVEFLPQVDDFANYIVNAEIGLDTSLSKKLSLRTFVQDTYTSQPAAGREKNDIKLVVAIAYKF